MRIYKEVVVVGTSLMASANVSGTFGDYDVEDIRLYLIPTDDDNVTELLECCYDSKGVPIMRLAEIAFREAVE